MTRITHLLLALAAAIASVPLAAAAERWTAEQAHAWYDEQPWLVGANYTPATAINQLEMWQATTWDPETIDKELGWAGEIGMNTMRVYLHNLLWEQDAEGFKSRMDEFLDIAESHDIRVMFVLFDSVWDPNPKPGPQHPPIPGVHNSGWVQSPGAARLADESGYGELWAYVKDIVGAFADDDRVIVWDIWNEPNNPGGGNYPPTPSKNEYVEILLPQMFEAARSADPSQPLTSGLWVGGDWSYEALDPIEKIQVSRSDVISFHDYSWPESFQRHVNQLRAYGRPIICTEYMARGNGSTFDVILPLGKAQNIAMYNWGLVDGKTQTRLPWDSWKKPYTWDEPAIWFHDVFHADGTPYRKTETELIKRLSSAPKGLVPED